MISFKIKRIKIYHIQWDCKKEILIKDVRLIEDSLMNNVSDKDHFKKLMIQIKMSFLSIIRQIKICFTLKRIEKKKFIIILMIIFWYFYFCYLKTNLWKFLKNYRKVWFAFILFVKIKWIKKKYVLDQMNNQKYYLLLNNQIYN